MFCPFFQQISRTSYKFLRENVFVRLSAFMHIGLLLTNSRQISSDVLVAALTYGTANIACAAIDWCKQPEIAPSSRETKWDTGTSVCAAGLGL
jgi:hypothetical protein